jgi:hypothetical protein
MIAMEAFQLMVDKDLGLYGAISEFIRKIWSAVKGVVESVSEKVTSSLTRLRALKTPETDAEGVLSKDVVSN